MGLPTMPSQYVLQNLHLVLFPELYKDVTKHQRWCILVLSYSARTAGFVNAALVSIAHCSHN